MENKFEKGKKTRIAKHGEGTYSQMGQASVIARGIPLDPKDRFLSHLKINTATNCWEWQGAQDGHGYGVASVKNRAVKAHRWAYELFKGPIPKELVIDHLCRNRLCVNPDHLELVSSRENTARGDGPSSTATRTNHCKNGHPLEGENLTIRKNGTRGCKACNKRSTQVYREKKNAELGRTPERRRDYQRMLASGRADCLDCGENLPLSRFRFSGGGKYLKSYCKRCENKRTTVRRKAKRQAS